jgi:hypothetical protein
MASNVPTGSGVDGQGVIAAFAFGIAVGFFLVYPSLPSGLRTVDLDAISFSVGPVGGPLLIAVAMFAFFFLGVFVLNWLFLEEDI